MLQPRDFMVHCGQVWQNTSEEAKQKFKVRAQPGLDQWKRDLEVYNKQKRSKKATRTLWDCRMWVSAMPNCGAGLIVIVCSVGVW